MKWNDFLCRVKQAGKHIRSGKPETATKNILIAPLNWGLGHATRCIPVIKSLMQMGFNPIIASDGSALALLKKEFPQLTALELPSYHIEYASKAGNLKWKLLHNSPKTLRAIIREYRLVNKWTVEHNLSGIISDNRFGVRSSKVPSVYITHQLTVLSGKTTGLSSWIHQSIIKRFDECWVPDNKGFPNLSGKLGNIKAPKFKLRYLGPLSRFEKRPLPMRYRLMVLLSGPEPQRTLLEEKLIFELKDYPGKVVFIKGLVQGEQHSWQQGNITFYNYMQTEQLEHTFNESELVLCRSGYSSIMDLAALGKNAYFIPTPGQYEQEYLAQKMKTEGFAPYSQQHLFTLKELLQPQNHCIPQIVSGLKNSEELFRIFIQTHTAKNSF